MERKQVTKPEMKLQATQIDREREEQDSNGRNQQEHGRLAGVTRGQIRDWCWHYQPAYPSAPIVACTGYQ